MGVYYTYSSETGLVAHDDADRPPAALPEKGHPHTIQVSDKITLTITPTDSTSVEQHHAAIAHYEETIFGDDPEKLSKRRATRSEARFRALLASNPAKVIRTLARDDKGRFSMRTVLRLKAYAATIRPKSILKPVAAVDVIATPRRHSRAFRTHASEGASGSASGGGGDPDPEPDSNPERPRVAMGINLHKRPAGPPPTH